MRENLKNVPIRKRITVLAIVAIVIMTMLSVIGLITASIVGKVIITLTYIVGAIAGVIATHEIALSIVEQIRDVNDIMENVASGNLDVTVAEKKYTKEEFGTLFSCIDLTLKKLSTYVAYINEVSYSLDKIADGYMKIELNHDYKGEFAILKNSLLITILK